MVSGAEASVCPESLRFADDHFRLERRIRSEQLHRRPRHYLDFGFRISH
jgi:hypothetical protein